MKVCTCTAMGADPECAVGKVVGTHGPGAEIDERRRVPDRRRPRWQVFDEPVPFAQLHQHLGVRFDALPAGVLLRVRIEVLDRDREGPPFPRKLVETQILVGSVNALGAQCGDCACRGEVLAISYDLVPLVHALGVPAAGVPA
jgi:hypothetical protein